jgi:ribosomal protein L24E
MNGEICYFCKKKMGNSLNKVYIRIDTKIVKVHCHAHCENQARNKE